MILDRLAKLDRFAAAAGRVHAGFAAVKEDERSLHDRVDAPPENRLGCALNMVEALLVSDGTSSTEARMSAPPSPARKELHVVRSVMDEVAVCKRGTSNVADAKSGEDTTEVDVSGVSTYWTGLGSGMSFSLDTEIKVIGSCDKAGEMVDSSDDLVTIENRGSSPASTISTSGASCSISFNPES